MQEGEVGLIAVIFVASLIVLGLGAAVYNDLKKPEAEEGAEAEEGTEARAGAGEGAGRGRTGYDADSERSSIISNISEGDLYSIHSGGGSRRKHRKSNKGSKGRKASKGSKGRKSRKHNNKKSKSKNSKSF